MNGRFWAELWMVLALLVIVTGLLGATGADLAIASHFYRQVTGRLAPCCRGNSCTGYTGSRPWCCRSLAWQLLLPVISRSMSAT